MLSRINTATIYGIEGQVISVETDISNGMPSFNIVGQADNSIKESRDRIRSAITNSGAQYPKVRITVNMSPAGLKKRGSHFDLAIAMGILASSVQINDENLDKYCFIGELSLDGSLAETEGILPMVMAMKNKGFKHIVVPKANESEATLIKGVNIYAVSELQHLINHFNYGQELRPAESNLMYTREKEHESYPDFGDVKGQEAAKRAIMISVAGGHGLFMMGSPSTGKTMLAERIPGIMPEMEYDEIIESTVIYSILGMLSKEQPYIMKRPYRHPHHKITPAALLGGGIYPKPGEISLANKGILFLDELGEFSRETIESLRQPLEQKKITLNRTEYSCTYPADFLLIAASNPCKCGYYGDIRHKCTCTSAEIKNYRRKLSGPITDRIDMNIYLNPVEYNHLYDNQCMSSEEMRDYIIRARKIQKERFKESGILLNSQMDDCMIGKYAPFTSERERSFMYEAYNSLRLNPRTMAKVRKVARTIADLDGCEEVEIRHYSESLQYRGENRWKDI